jgi:hypothetical protein
MAQEMGYNDSVAQDGGAHDADSTADNGSQSGDNTEFPLRHMGPARKEYATPGHEGRSEATTPIGPQSGFSPLGSEEAPHGDGTYTSDDELRKEWSRKF